MIYAAAQTLGTAVPTAPHNLTSTNRFFTRHLHRETARVLVVRAGRLPHDEPPDAEPRPEVRPRLRREGERTHGRARSVQSTGTGNRPNRICDGNLPNPTIDRWFDTSCFVPTADVTGTCGDAGRGIIRGPGSFNTDASLIKNTRVGRYTTEVRIEAFNLLNHPQFANPNTTIGNAAVGTISAMLSDPSCSLCGTTERQIQLALEVRF